MKRNGLIVGCLFVVVISIMAIFIFSGPKPYKDLKTSDIVSATVHLSPPDKTAEIKEIKELDHISMRLLSIMKTIHIQNMLVRQLYLHL